MNRFELPNGFTIDDKLYKVIYLNEMTGVQQDKLANVKYRSKIDHVEPIFIDLIEKVEDSEGNRCQATNQDIVTKFIEVADIEFLLVKLKDITFGEVHIQEGLECPHCSKKQEGRIQLDKLEVIKPESVRPNAIKLSKSGKEVVFKPLTYADLKKYASDPERLLNNASTSAASMRVGKLGEETNVSEAQIKALPAKDLNQINKEAPESCKIDLHFEHTCISCGKDFEYDLEVLAPDFLTQ
jgi:DNA-directed RNA polymerase subunit RPC12/RpoP